MRWLAEQMGMHRVSLHRKMHTGFSADERRQLVKVLGVPHDRLFSVPSTVIVDQVQPPEA